MTLKADQQKDELLFAAVITQLRRAYGMLTNEDKTMLMPLGAWDVDQRRDFARGMILPQIGRLELLQLPDHSCPKHEAMFASLQQHLLQHAGQIGSASQARRIIIMAFDRARRGEL